MAQVNVAYEKGDEVAIKKLIQEYGQDPEAIKGDDAGARLIKANALGQHEPDVGMTAMAGIFLWALLAE